MTDELILNAHEQVNAVEIRELRPEEMPEMISLVAAWNSTVPTEALNERLAAMLQIGYRCIGALADGKIVGIAGFWIGWRFWCGRYLDVDNVIVAEDWRNHAIGQRLMAWVHEEAHRLECDVAVLDAYVTNTDAHRFYERMGYEKVGYHLVKRMHAD